MVDFASLSVSSKEGLLTIEAPMKVVTLNHLLINAVNTEDNILKVTTKTETIHFKAGSPEEAQEAKQMIIELVR